MEDSDRIRIAYQDASNRVAVSLVYTDHAEEALDIANLEPLISAVVATEVIEVRQDTGIYGPTPGAGGSGSYATYRDMVTLEFRAQDGSTWPVTIVGPKSSIFLTDTETVDPGNDDVDSLITWLLDFARTKSGVSLIEYKRGWRWYLSSE